LGSAVSGLILRICDRRAGAPGIAVPEGVREPKVVVALILSILSTAGCNGMTAMMPTGPSSSLAYSQAASAPPEAPAAPQAPAGPTVPAAQVVTGVIQPLTVTGERCYFNLYACEAFNFSLAADGGLEVTLAWDGGARDIMIQLYRADIGIVHEDLAPRGGASRITFRRPDLAAMDYQLRVVSMQKDAAVPFTLTYTHWEN
jgi:hypothetical protein